MTGRFQSRRKRRSLPGLRSGRENWFSSCGAYLSRLRYRSSRGSSGRETPLWLSSGQPRKVR